MLTQLHFDPARQSDAGLQVILLQGDHRLDCQRRQQLVTQRATGFALAPAFELFVEHAIGLKQAQLGSTGPDIGQHQHGKALGNRIGDVLAPLVDQVELATIDQHQAAAIHQRGEHFRVFSQTGVLDGQVLHVMVGKPQAGIEMQLFEPLRVTFFQATAQKLGKQVVKAVPLTLAVQRQQE